jgi:hypothetical protein
VDARLAVGNNGETLVADSAATTGLRYQAHTEAGKNFIINGGADVWQRGTSVATTGRVYTGDRFETWSTAGAATTTSRQLTNDTTNLPGIQYCARVQRNSGQTLTGAVAYQTSLESINSIPLAGKSIVVSFYARKGADYSAASSLLTVKVITGTGTDQNVTGYTGAIEIVNSTATLTTTWQRFQFTATVGATATEIGFQPYSLPTGTAGTNDYYEITGIQLELGSVPSTFSRAAGNGNIQGELAACQRYFYRATPLSGGDSYGTLCTGFATNTTDIELFMNLPVPLRTKAASIAYSTIRGFDYSSTFTISSLTLESQRQQGLICTFLAKTTSLTQFRPGVLEANNSSSGYIEVSAEL